MSGLAIASTSDLAADAATEISAAGGNAIDAAIAATMVSAVTEPGVSSLGGGAFIALSREGGTPVIIDGNVRVPGLGASGENPHLIDVYTDYGGGLRTLVGYGSIATPGGLAAFAHASRHYGVLPWSMLCEPALRRARDGFVLRAPSTTYLRHTHETIFGWQEETRVAIHNDDGRFVEEGATVVILGLAKTLAEIARDGTDTFYRGPLGERIGQEIRANGGLLGFEDLQSYCVREVEPIATQLGDWTINAPSPPSIGGATLSAMLQMLHGNFADGLTETTLDQLLDAQCRVLDYRRQHLDKSDDLDEAIKTLLGQAHVLAGTSQATAHTSAVDDAGNACAVTISSGYGSGVSPAGTGLWMNNTLGELELNPDGPGGLSPGAPLRSNMTPVIALTDDGGVLAIGSPGADRIVTAMLQTILYLMDTGLSLAEAIAHPRAHVELGDSEARVAYEEDLPVRPSGIHGRVFPAHSMFFGGVGAAMLTPERGLEAAADPRRNGVALATSP